MRYGKLLQRQVRHTSDGEEQFATPMERIWFIQVCMYPVH